MLRRLLIPLLGALALALTTFAASPAAHAEDDNAVGACLAAEKVWLLVVTDTDEVLANECVDTPATGTEALTNAGLELSLDGNGFLCAIGGHPSPCPATFEGQFWNYYQGAAGAEYTFSDKGADVAEPKPGTIEAWCYNKAEEKSCTPPYLRIVKDGAEVAAPAGVTVQDLAVTGEAPAPTSSATATDSPTTAPSEEPAADANSRTLPIVLGVVVLAAVAVAILVGKNKKRSGKGGAVGGR
jgi:hypothetical protein